MEQQTAVEYLEAGYHNLCLELKTLDMSMTEFNKRLSGLFEYSKQMEKQQIIDAHYAEERMEKNQMIDRKKIYELYMEEVCRIAEECDWVTHIDPKTLVSIVINIIEEEYLKPKT
jgi:hypothetical protein